MIRKILLIYEPKVKTMKYTPLAINLYSGCDHGCVYCYTPEATFSESEVLNNPVPCPGIIDRLESGVSKDARHGAADKVLPCFTSDPYQPIDDIHKITRQAIKDFT